MNEKYKQLKIKWEYLEKKYYEKFKLNKYYNSNYNRIFKFNFINNLNLEERFNTEIINFNWYLDEYNSFQNFLDSKLINILNKEILKISNKIEVIVYGSFKTNLNWPFSDIDIYLKNVDNTNIWIDLEKILTNYGFETKLYINANHPILKMKTKKEYNHKEVDIIIFQNSNQGLNCINLINNYCLIYPKLKYITRVFKQILNNNMLNNPFHGGLSSYSMILILVSFLQSYEFINKSEYNKSFYYFFNDFLKFMIDFDYTKLKLKPNNNKDFSLNPIITKSSINNNLIIIDPLDKSNNVSKSSYNFEKIKYTFSIIYITLYQVNNNYINSSIWFDRIKHNRCKYDYKINHKYQIIEKKYIILRNIIFSNFS